MKRRGSHHQDDEAELTDSARDADPDLDLSSIGHDDDYLDEHDEEHHSHGSFAATALWVVLSVLTVMVLTIWAAPKIAPHVPAPLGRVLAPVSDVVETEIAALRRAAEEREAETERQIAALRAELSVDTGPDPARLEAIETALERIGTGAEAADTAADAARAEARAALAAAETAKLEARSAAERADAAHSLGLAGQSETEVLTATLNGTRRDLDTAVSRASDLSRRLTSLDAQLAGMSEEVRALSTAISEMPAEGTDEGPAPRELAAALSALQARVDGIRTELAARPEAVTPEDARALAAQSSATAIEALLPRLEAARSALEERLSGAMDAERARLQTELAALDTRIRAAEETARITRAEALDDAEAALARAALRGARDALLSRVASGAPYAAILAEVEALSGRKAEDALARHAAEGLAPAARLSERFPGLARAALEADARAAAEDGAPGERVSSWLRSQVFTRPTAEQEGDDLAARLSRIEARLGEGALDTALTEVDALPAEAATVFAGWTADLRQRVEAEAALARFVADGPNGAATSAASD